MAELDTILGPDDGGMDMAMGDAGAGAPRRNPAYEQLLTAWRSEKACPELLQWRGDLVDGLLDAAEQQEAMVKATVEQGGDVDECLFSAPLYESGVASSPEVTCAAACGSWSGSAATSSRTTTRMQGCPTRRRRTR